MEIRTYKVYKFRELPETIQEKAVDKLRDINIDYSWYEYDGILDVHQAEWLKYGLKDCLFKYRTVGFEFEPGYGDYLRFVDLEVTDEEVFRKALGVSKRAWEKTRYYFPKCAARFSNTRLTFEDPEAYSGRSFTGKEEAAIDRAIRTFDGWRREALIGLRRQYQYLVSDKAIVETIEANDWWFRGNGEIDTAIPEAPGK